MDIAVNKVMKVVNEMVEEYELDRKFITLVGGGGSGAVLVHALADKGGFKSKVAENAPYISTIGVALAMVREQIERSVVAPSEDDIKKIREDIIEKIVQSGANEATVDVTIEIDSQKNILRAIATGSTELRSKDLAQSVASEDDMKEVVSGALSVEKSTVELVSNTGRWYLFKAVTQKKAFFGLFKKTLNNICMVDREGVVRLKKENAYNLTFRKDATLSDFVAFLDQHTIYSDANATIPKVFLFYKEKMLDLTGMQTKEQLLSIIDVETKFMENDEKMITVVYK